MNNLTSNDWQGIFKKFPGLEGEIARINNSRELMQLRHDLTLKKFLSKERIAWVENRVKELEGANVREI